jgi:hypothetical protein
MPNKMISEIMKIVITIRCCLTKCDLLLVQIYSFCFSMTMMKMIMNLLLVRFKKFFDEQVKIIVTEGYYFLKYGI